EPSLISDPRTQARSRTLIITEAVAHGAGKTAEMLEADLIVVATHSGRTAMAVSKQRNHVPVLGASNQPASARRMCLHGGLTPLRLQQEEMAPAELMTPGVEWGLSRQVLRSGSKFVLVASSSSTAGAGHGLLWVHVVP